MGRLLSTVILCGTVLSGTLPAQADQTAPLPSAAPPAMPPRPPLPPGIGPQSGPNDMPGAVGARSMPSVPSAFDENLGQTAGARSRPTPAEPTAVTPGLIPLLDSMTPYVQAFDFVLMLVAAVFCLQARKAPGLTILSISCFISAAILLGFFLFSVFHGRGAFPQAAYIIARILAPFELLLFAIAIVMVARASRKSFG